MNSQPSDCPNQGMSHVWTKPDRLGISECVMCGQIRKVKRMDENGMSQAIHEERMMKWFAYDHLPQHLRDVSKQFHGVACNIAERIQAGPERTVALRKLLEAKDAAVRAVVNPGG